MHINTLTDKIVCLNNNVALGVPEVYKSADDIFHTQNWFVSEQTDVGLEGLKSAEMFTLSYQMTLHTCLCGGISL